MTVAVASRKIHFDINSAGILTQGLFHNAHGLDKLAPIDGFDDRDSPRNVTPAAHAEADEPKTTKTADWRTLDDEMDACKSLAELEAWNVRRRDDITALPKPKFTLLADKFGDLRERLIAKEDAAQDEEVFA